MNEMYRILIADDNQINLQVFGRLIKKLGFEYDMVSNGEEAVNAVTIKKYSIVFMDIHMPVMGGVEATNKIKTNIIENCPVIIALTADSFLGDEEELLSAGMDDYLAKPVNKESLQSKLTKWLPNN